MGIVVKNLSLLQFFSYFTLEFMKKNSSFSKGYKHFYLLFLCLPQKKVSFKKKQKISKNSKTQFNSIFKLKVFQRKIFSIIFFFLNFPTQLHSIFVFFYIKKQPSIFTKEILLVVFTILLFVKIFFMDRNFGPHLYFYILSLSYFFYIRFICKISFFYCDFYIISYLLFHIIKKFSYGNK